MNSRTIILGLDVDLHEAIYNTGKIDVSFVYDASLKPPTAAPLAERR